MTLMMNDERTAEKLEALEEEIKNALGREMTTTEPEPATALVDDSPAQRKFDAARTAFAKVLEETFSNKGRCEQEMAAVHARHDANVRDLVAQRDHELARLQHEMDRIEWLREGLEKGLGCMNKRAQG